MTTASGNPKRLVCAAILCALTIAMLACGTSVNLTPVSPSQTTPIVQPTEIQEPTQPAIPADACYTGIIPGQTARDDIIVALGEPAFTHEEVGIETMEYPSYIDGLNDVVIVENNKVVLIGMFLNPDVVSLTRLKGMVGEPEQVTYSYYMASTRTYLYPQQGLAFIVEPEAGLVFYQECVTPMPMDQYMASWGSELPLEDPFNE